MTWNDRFLELFDCCLEKHRSGNTDYDNYYSEAELTFLASIGHKPRELYDFVEDLADQGVPSRSDALLVAAVRRDYFLVVQGGKPSDKEFTANDVPSYGEELSGIQYLPRVIAKAKLKLKGELDPNLMYGCGGDRNFLEKNGNIHPADFLRHVWAADGDDSQVVAFVKSHH